jgi:hypothetical protein
MFRSAWRPMSDGSRIATGILVIAALGSIAFEWRFDPDRIARGAEVHRHICQGYTNVVEATSPNTSSRFRTMLRTRPFCRLSLPAI